MKSKEIRFLFFIVIILLFFTTLIPQQVFAQCVEDNGFYQCKSGKKCIPISWLCDSRNDCPLGDDEQNASCGSSEDRGDCEVFHFECIDPHSKKKRCARREWRCDGFIDCLNAVDEVNCEPLPTPMQSLPGQPTPPSLKPNDIKMEECKADEFQCKSGDECIERDNVCDDVRHCKDGSDESEEKCATPPIKPLIQPIFNVNESGSNMKNKTTTTKIVNITKEAPKNESKMSTTTFIPKFFEVLSTKSITTMLQTTFKPTLPIIQNVAPFIQEKMPLVISSSTFINPITTAPLKIIESPSTKTIFNIAPLQTITTLKPFWIQPSFLTSSSPKPPSIFTTRPSSSLITPTKGIFLSSSLHNALLMASQKDESAEKPKIQSYKMSAETIKEKPEHLNVISQSNIISASSQETMEPIHPNIGKPIIPVNRFQILIPLDALKESNKQSKEKTTVKVESSKAQENERKITTTKKP